ncbi:hypothetical protein A0H81_01343 [Grifola frondosa]|uniref:Uncharacterized protein n=1 Tax=Grifola frondosa TaxID=5627 RepID=A0A1C7MX61_GRIFR|nr:hypothetical protein A0H81_01343 [Grifola frondosa]
MPPYGYSLLHPVLNIPSGFFSNIFKRVFERNLHATSSWCSRCSSSRHSRRPGASSALSSNYDRPWIFRRQLINHAVVIDQIIGTSLAMEVVSTQHDYFINLITHRSDSQEEDGPIALDEDFESSKECLSSQRFSCFSSELSYGDDSYTKSVTTVNEHESNYIEWKPHSSGNLRSYRDMKDEDRSDNTSINLNHCSQPNTSAVQFVVEDLGDICTGGPGGLLSVTKESDGNLSTYFTVPSHLTGISQDQEIVPQMIDLDSGVIFDNICEGTGNNVATEILRKQQGNLICPITAGSNVAELGWLGTLGAPIPSLILTLATPEVPKSPIFLPQSPITLPKFVSAASSSVDHALPMTTRLSPVPSLPICRRCSLEHLETEAQCRACEKQWLTCKIWYQANDGGNKRWLTAPYIKPAESNSSNRAVMDRLGVPIGPLGLGLGIQLPKKRTYRTLVSRVTAHVGKVWPSAARDGHGEFTATTKAGAGLTALIGDSRRVQKPNTGSLSRLRALWMLGTLLRIRGDPVDHVRTTAGSPDFSSAQNSTPEVKLRSPFCDIGPPLQRVTIKSGSRFIEHLEF